MQLVALDFETFYSDEFTLRKLNSEAYIRDARFHIHCAGIKSNDYRGYYDGAGFTAGYAKTLETAAVVCHHAHFDGLILAHHCGVKPALWIDTLSMARLLHPDLKSISLESLAAHYGLTPKTVPYDLFKGKRYLDAGTMRLLGEGAAHDAELTYAIAKAMLKVFPREELLVIDQTIRMFTEPAFRLDAPRLSKYLSEYRVGKKNILDSAGIPAEALRSNKLFAEVLESLGVEPPMKISPKTKLPAYAFAKTDDGMKELVGSDNPIVATLAAARLGEKSTIIETRSERFLDTATRGAIPVYLYYYGAHTGRFASGDKMGMQNLPRGSELRKSLTAPDGFKIAVGDCSQIECRLLNYEAGERWVLDAFAEGRDLYSEGASKFYKRTITRADKLERHLGKTIELGCGFQMGANKFRLTCRGGALGGPPIILSEAEAAEAVGLYRQTHPNVVNYWKRAKQVIVDLYMGTSDYQWGSFRVKGRRVYLPNGAWVSYETISRDADGFFLTGKRGRVSLYEGKLVENIIQALARVVMTQAMLRIAARYKVLTTTHDEIVCLVPEAEADVALAFILGELKRQPVWATAGELPLDADGGVAREYSK